MSDGTTPPDPNQPHQPPPVPQQPGAGQPQPAQPVPQPPDNMGLNMPASTPTPAPPKKSLPWGMIIRIGIGVIVLGGIIFTQCGKTGADDLDLGDCFEIPDEGDFSRVTNQDCAGAHEAQIYAEAPLLTTINSCESLLIELIIDTTATIPDDVSLAQITDEDEIGGGWCVVTSTSGQLVGSVLD